MLLGRSTELEQIGKFLARLPDSGAHLLFVGGAGLGKTALLTKAAEDAVASGMLVLRACAVESEIGLDFAGLNQMLLPVSCDLDRFADQYGDVLATALGLRPGRLPGRYEVSKAVLGVLRRLSAVSPTVVIVDDLQWLDRLSVEVLSFVSRRVADSRVGVLAAARPAGREVILRAGWPTHELTPLDNGAAHQLLQSRFPMLASSVRMRLVAEAAGNPLALLELPTALTEGQRRAFQPLPSALPLSHRLEILFASGITALPAATQEMLLLAALDESRDLGVLQIATRSHELRDLWPAEQADLVRVDEGNGQLEFRHPLIRSAVVATASRIRRQQAHLILAELHAEQPDSYAWHLGEASTTPDESIAALLETAARRAAADDDPARAARELTHAARLSPRPADSARRKTDAAVLEIRAGDLASAIRLLPGPSDSSSGTRKLQVASVVAFRELNSDGEIDSAHRILSDVLRACGDRLDAANDAVMTAVRMLSTVSFFAGRAEPWQEWEGIVDSLAPEAPEDVCLTRGVLPDPVRTAGAVLPQLDAAIGRLHANRDPVRARVIAWVAFNIDRLTGCRPIASRARETASGAVNTSLFLPVCLDDFATGKWGKLRSGAESCIAMFSNHDMPVYLQLGRYCEALLAAARGEDEVARDLADEISRWAEPRRAELLTCLAARVRGLAALSRGDFTAAYRHAVTISPAGTLAGYSRVAPWVCLDLVDAATHTGRHSEAIAHAAALEAAGVAGLSGRLSLLATGAAAIAAEDDQRALGLFERALNTPGVSRWPFERARVQLAYGERLRRGRSTAAAADQLANACEAFQRLGAEVWARRASQELRATGRSLPPVVATTSQETLTNQERKVAELAAMGLSNKEIAEQLYVSARTVSTHLYHLYPKLGVSTRGALRNALRQSSGSP
ncbi:MAG TPA: AAA family ATPase [Streptosporangiaceae bacterium]|nr:AAA family ATPase [Streptosporangiaceae bacterium]HYK69108.1 AAA family ATPase [Streptosporangiaceae bacterium]